MTRTTTVVQTVTRSIPAKLAHKKPHKTQAALWPPKYPIQTIQFGTNRVLSQALAPRLISPQPVSSESISSESISSEPISTAFIPQQMSVLGLNHFNITASPSFIEQIKNFYVDVIGLTIGPRAQLDHSGFWLYAGNSPILHLSARQQSLCQQSLCQQSTTKEIAETESAETELAKSGSLEREMPMTEGCFNHISLDCTGLAATLKKLIAMEIPYKISIVPDFGQTQVFIKDPAGIVVELTFLE
jgi:hypothetical protein